MYQPFRAIAVKISVSTLYWALFVGVFALVCVTLLVSTRAATNTASFEPENGTLNSAGLVSDSTASGGGAVRFGGTVPPTAWPGGLPELGFSLNGEALSGPLQQSHYNELASITPYAEWARIGFSSDGDWQTNSQRYFDAATQAGMKVLLRASFPGSQYNSSQPVNVNAYGDFVAAMATRYKAKGLGGTNPVMEMPNEINGTSISGATYAAAACNAYPKLKAVDPNYVIIGASENVYASNWKTWLEDVYKGGFANCSDGVSFHNYDAPGDGARYDFLRSLMTKYNDLDAKVWVTEFGATTCTPASSSALGCRTEQQQADKLVGNIRDMKQKYPWISHAIVYADEDIPSRKTTDPFEAYFGIYRNDANGNITGAKPAVAALKALYGPNSP